jgi:hypothetical protein
MVRAVGKKSIRSPINLRSTTLRDNPFRMKLLWDDDNEAVRYSTEEVFRVPTLLRPEEIKQVYKVQRRRLGHTRYETFPFTANTFLIDEEETDDFVPFQQLKSEDSVGATANKTSISQNSFLSAPSPTISIPSLTSLSLGSSLVSPSVTLETRTPSISEIVGVQDEETQEAIVRRSFGLPAFLKMDNVYFYRVAAVSRERGEESNFSPELKVLVFRALSDPLDLTARVEDARVRPIIAKLSWATDEQLSRPDRWVIERKNDVATDTFDLIGAAYLREEFLDRTVKPGNRYIYRVKSVDTLGRESNFFEVRLTT